MSIRKKICNLFEENRQIVYGISYILFVLYSCLMIWEVFIGPYRSFAGVRRYNIHPFKTIIEYLFNTKQYSSRVIFINIVANIITFIPLGFFLCLLFKRFRKPFNMALCSFIVIAIIEIMQFVLNVGVFDVDDIVLNTAGCLLGYVIYRIMKKFMSKS